ncbi:MAG TPA: hypothetical protein VME70_13975 [Mycobacteriales bacterium]|nr:hypothetical protein [Mycobacteriales bacterium]
MCVPIALIGLCLVGCSDGGGECSSTSPLHQGVLVSASGYFASHPAARTLTVCADHRCATSTSYETTLQPLNSDHTLHLRITVRSMHRRTLMRRSVVATYRLRHTSDNCGSSAAVRSLTIAISQDGAVQVLSQ